MQGTPTERSAHRQARRLRRRQGCLRKRGTNHDPVPRRVRQRERRESSSLRVATATAVLTAIGVLVAVAGFFRPAVVIEYHPFWIVISPGHLGVEVFPGIDIDGIGTSSTDAGDAAVASTDRSLVLFADERAGPRMRCVAAARPRRAAGEVTCSMDGRTFTYTKFRTGRLTRDYFRATTSGWRPLSSGPCSGSSTSWKKPDGTRDGLFAFGSKGTIPSLAWTYEAAHIVARIRAPEASAVCGSWLRTAL
jgi:hypothetical protein